MYVPHGLMRLKLPPCIGQDQDHLLGFEKRSVACTPNPPITYQPSLIVAAFVKADIKFERLHGRSGGTCSLDNALGQGMSRAKTRDKRSRRTASSHTNARSTDISPTQATETQEGDLIEMRHPTSFALVHLCDLAMDLSGIQNDMPLKWKSRVLLSWPR